MEYPTMNSKFSTKENHDFWKESWEISGRQFLVVKLNNTYTLCREGQHSVHTERKEGEKDLNVEFHIIIL